MNERIRIGTRVYRIGKRRTLQTAENELRFQSFLSALQFLKRFSHDARNMAVFRRVLASCCFGADMTRVRDRHLLDRLATALSKGLVAVVEDSLRAFSSSRGGAVSDSDISRAPGGAEDGVAASYSLASRDGPAPIALKASGDEASPDEKTEKEKPVKFEFLIVTTAEDYYQSAGNKMMFMAQTVRYAKDFGHLFDIVTVFYFDASHSSNQVEAFRKSVEKYGGNAKRAGEWSDIANHMNNTDIVLNGEECVKKVQVLIFFAHGTPGQIWLENTNRKYFRETEAKEVNKDAFADEPSGRYSKIHMTSWACQTGNAGNPVWSVEENMANSLAQKTADLFGINVYASATKTDYSQTWSGGLYGLFDMGRETIDEGTDHEAVWEDNGADGKIQSSDVSAQGTMESGMYVFSPGQKTDYQKIELQ